jgi:hypothetical protein
MRYDRCQLSQRSHLFAVPGLDQRHIVGVESTFEENRTHSTEPCPGKSRHAVVAHVEHLGSAHAHAIQDELEHCQIRLDQAGAGTEYGVIEVTAQAGLQPDLRDVRIAVGNKPHRDSLRAEIGEELQRTGQQHHAVAQELDIQVLHVEQLLRRRFIAVQSGNERCVVGDRCKTSAQTIVASRHPARTKRTGGHVDGLGTTTQHFHVLSSSEGSQQTTVEVEQHGFRPARAGDAGGHSAALKSVRDDIERPVPHLVSPFRLGAPAPG